MVRIGGSEGSRVRRSGGFTLIELMIVMSLIVILAGIGLTVYANSVTRAKEAVLKEDLYRMRQAIDQYYADKNRYPESLDVLITERYLRAMPVDPFTNSVATWQTIQADIEPGNITAAPGIYDVKSGAPGRALDGTAYNEW
ncbi:MAG: prepilin-type N-terminal cleavage/methylation domain-containing protein [Vicinamibacterales bacterium]